MSKLFVPLVLLLRDLMAGATGLEPATSCVTGRRTNQLLLLSMTDSTLESGGGFPAREQFVASWLLLILRSLERFNSATICFLAPLASG